MNLGSSYKNNIECNEFFGMALSKELVYKLTRAMFFSIRAEGSTDTGRLKGGLILVLFLDLAQKMI